mgnify:CR=1 FL=1
MAGGDEIYGFDWDAGNRGKSLKKHGITDDESEEVFFDQKKRIFKDTVHSETEERFILVGMSRSGKRLFIAFTFRKSVIRVISSRPLNKKEQKLYEEKT